MSADQKKEATSRISQPLEPAPMPEYRFQRYSLLRDEDIRPTGKDAAPRELDLSQVVLNLS